MSEQETTGSNAQAEHLKAVDVVCPGLGSEEMRGLGERKPCDAPPARLVNILLAGLMLFFALPLIGVLALSIKLWDRGPAFYRGIRLGRYKEPFVMFKLRTLPLGTQQKLGAKLYSNTYGLTSPFTRFLRDTRLDELPQLFNVLRGDMNFVGPRPERPEVYETLCSTIHDYDHRFLVRPGLMGYSQVFTPHSTPKRLRSHLDYLYIVNNRNVFSDLYIVLYTMFILLRTIVSKSARFFWRYMVLHKLFPKYQRRVYERFYPERGKAFLVSRETQQPMFIGEFRLMDINEEAFRLLSDQPQDGVKHEFILQREIRKKGKQRVKRSRCWGEVYRRTEGLEPSTIVRYEAATPLNQYLLDKYFLQKSIV